MEARLRAFYAQYNPGNDQNIAEIVRKFEGREHVMCAKLYKKYGAAPNLTGAVGNTTRSQSLYVEKVAVEGGDVSSANQPQYNEHYQPWSIPIRTGGALDFRSAEFNPEKALYSSGLKPLVHTHPLDYVQKCRHLLPESDPNYQTLVLQSKKKPLSLEQTHATVIVKKLPTLTLLDQLADTYLEGPFTALRRWFLDRKRVIVVIRRVNSIRGTCTGFLKAFDKHMNIVLLDATEEFIPHDTHVKMLHDIRSGKLIAADSTFSVADARRNRRFTKKQYSKQLFIRGDNVVMVCEDKKQIRHMN